MLKQFQYLFLLKCFLTNQQVAEMRLFVVFCSDGGSHKRKSSPDDQRDRPGHLDLSGKKKSKSKVTRFFRSLLKRHPRSSNSAEMRFHPSAAEEKKHHDKGIRLLEYFEVACHLVVILVFILCIDMQQSYSFCGIFSFFILCLMSQVLVKIVMIVCLKSIDGVELQSKDFHFFSA